MDMKKKYVWTAAFSMLCGLVMTACSEDKGENIDNQAVAGEAFVCIEQIIDGCVDIASEVGETKIGDPLDKYNAGKVTEALYAVESWYSWHSREDYRNNIYSIRNAYYGSRDGSIATASLATLVGTYNATLDKLVKEAISQAAEAIWSIPQPFRNNINCSEARLAQQTCADLVEVLGDLKAYIERTAAVNGDEVLDPIVTHYVDHVVLPTYKELKEKNEALYAAVQAFRQAPGNRAFEAVCDAWLVARQPWETSEAFLFGPVDAEGLDPNMDSWPLDQDDIVRILNSGNFDNLDWSDGDSDDAVEAKQGVRGFHTLEFLAFRNGQARTLNDVAASDSNNDLVYNDVNAASWGNYMLQVAYLLKQDAANLYQYWAVSYRGGAAYADRFKAHQVN